MAYWIEKQMHDQNHFKFSKLYVNLHLQANTFTHTCIHVKKEGLPRAHASYNNEHDVNVDIDITE